MLAWRCNIPVSYSHHDALFPCIIDKCFEKLEPEKNKSRLVDSSEQLQFVSHFHTGRILGLWRPHPVLRRTGVEPPHVAHRQEQPYLKGQRGSLRPGHSVYRVRLAKSFETLLLSGATE